MSERYTRLFSLAENLYAEGSPVVIAAGALLKDAHTGNILAQLKIRNISEKIIKAATVSICPLDTVGKSIGELVTYQYLDLQVSRDGEFGTQIPIVLPDAATRAYSVAVTQVIFTDNTTQQVKQNDWESLEKSVSLESVLGDAELCKQYRIQFGADCSCQPTEYKDLWFCACGALNHKEEETCHVCGKTAEKLLQADMDALKQACDVRVKAEREKAEQDRAANEAKQKKLKKILAILLPSVAAVVAVVVLINSVIIPTYNYNKALNLMNAGDYTQAISAFQVMNGYKDSAEKINECQYNAAIALMDAGKYEEAIVAFEALDGYRLSDYKITDCNNLITDGKYNEAVALMDAGNLDDAYGILQELGEYKDAVAKADAIRLTKTKEQLQNVKVGDYIMFGAYEQDNNTSNGKEDIEWLVLDKQDDRVFVISKSALDFVKYNVTKKDMTWEECTLRTWLNSDFFDLAFNDSEKSLIPVVTVPVDENPAYDTVYGNSTQDKIYVLSMTEAEKYFNSNEERDCPYTDYAVSKLAGKSIYGWWLRTTGMAQYAVAFIAGDGGIIGNGENYIEQTNSRLVSINVDSRVVAVRPAMWIDLTAIQ